MHRTGVQPSKFHVDANTLPWSFASGAPHRFDSTCVLFAALSVGTSGKRELGDPLAGRQLMSSLAFRAHHAVN